nr:hypothetical protein CFP56_23974 [Quercus suber]
MQSLARGIAIDHRGSAKGQEWFTCGCCCCGRTLSGLVFWRLTVFATHHWLTLSARSRTTIGLPHSVIRPQFVMARVAGTSVLRWSWLIVHHGARYHPHAEHAESHHCCRVEAFRRDIEVKCDITEDIEEWVSPPTVHVVHDATHLLKLCPCNVHARSRV